MGNNIIGIVDYGIGNIFSVVNTLEKLHIKYKLISNHEKIKKYNKIILIGSVLSPHAWKILKKKNSILL